MLHRTFSVSGLSFVTFVVIGCIPEPRLRDAGPDVFIVDAPADRQYVDSPGSDAHPLDAGFDAQTNPFDGSAACDAGTHRCVDRCVADDDPGACGSECRRCPIPSNGNAMCIGGACVSRCDDGWTPSGAECVPLPAPRPRSPLSTMFTSSAQPQLRWILPAGVSSVVVSICADRGCTRDVREYPVTGTEFRPPTALARGTWFWQLRSASGGVVSTARSPMWQFTVIGNAPREARWHGLPDLNGDGRAELIIGAPSADGGAGRVIIYDGTTLDMPRWTLMPPVGAPGAFGSVVSVIGDIVGDGFADLAVRSVGADEPQGLLSVYRGSALGPVVSSSIAFRAVRVGETFAETVDRGGDIDGDGMGDWIATSANTVARTGAVEVFFGSQDGTARRPGSVFEVSIPDYQFPRFVAAGDFDDDGFSDVVAGATYVQSRPDALMSHPGMLTLARGSGRGLDPSTIRETHAHEYENGFAITGAVLGDIDGNGFLDLVVGVPTPTDTVAYLLSGSLQGFRFPAYGSYRRASQTTLLGSLFVAAGDLNNDGHPDWIREQVRDRLFPGDPPGRQIITSSAPGENLITATDLMFPPGVVAAQADYTGDGIADLVIGDPSANTVSIYAGRTGGPSATPTRVIRAPSTDMIRFGASIAR